MTIFLVSKFTKQMSLWNVYAWQLFYVYLHIWVQNNPKHEMFEKKR